MGFLDKLWDDMTHGGVLNALVGNAADPLNSVSHALGLNSQADYFWKSVTDPHAMLGMAASDWSAIKHWLVPDMRRDREVQSQGATTARNVIYGRTRVGSQIAYAESTGDKNEILHLIFVHAGHEIDGYEEFYFDDKLVTSAATSWVIAAPYTGKVVIEQFDGSQTTACASLIAASAGGWTADHKLLGLAYTHITLTYDEAVFPAGLPTIKTVIRGKRVLDTRTGVIAWSDNPALCERDYLFTSVDEGGMGIEAEEIDENQCIVKANICDQLVESNIALDVNHNPVTPGVKSLYKPVTSSLEKRYTLNGVIVLDGSPASFVRTMLTASAGDAVYSEGRWKLFAGTPAASVADIDESWLNGGLSFQTGANKNDKNNSVKGVFTNSNDYWADTEFPPVPILISTPPNALYWDVLATPLQYNADSTYLLGAYVTWVSKVYKATAAVPANHPPPENGYWVLVEAHDNSLEYPPLYTVQRGGVVYKSSITVPVAHPYLAADGGEILEANLTLPYTITSSEAQRLAKIALEKSRQAFTLAYPCNHKAFKLEIMDVVTVYNSLLGMAKKFRVIGWEFSLLGGTNLSLIEYDDSIYNWIPGDSTPVVAPIITNLPDPWVVAPPTSFTATEVLYTGVAVANTKSRLDLSWTSAQASGSSYDILLDGVVVKNTTDTVYSINDLAPGTYTVSVRARTTLGTLSSWVTLNKTVVGQYVPPVNVASFTASFVGNLVKLAWIPNSEIDLAGYEIRTGVSWATGTVLQAALMGNGYTYRPTASGAITFWIKAFDTAGNESLVASTASATVPTADVPTAINTVSQFLEIDLDITFDTTRQDTLQVEIHAATTNNRSVASQIGTSKEKRWKHRNLNNGDTWYYWTRINTVFGETGSWYPSGVNSGVVGSALNDPKRMVQLMNPDITDASVVSYLADSTSLLKLLDTRSMLFELGVVGPGVTATYTDALAQAASQMNANQTLLQSLNSIVAGLVVTEYDNATAYTVGMIVDYLGQTYQCILPSTGNLPTNTTYWSPISGLYDLVNTIQQNLDTLSGTFTSTAATLTADIADLANPTDGRVTLAETTISQHGTDITLQGTAITGPLAFVVGAVTESGVVVETAEDVQGLDTTISSERIKLDSANAAILIEAFRIDNLTGRTTAAEIAIDGANGAILLKASQTALDALTGTVATKAAQIDLDSANAAILLRATSTDLTAAILVQSNLIGMSLTSPGATYTPGMTLTWSDASHTKSLLRVSTDSFQVGNIVSTVYSGTRAYLVDELVTYSSNTYRCILPSTGNVPTNTTYWVLATGLNYRPVFSVGNVNGISAVGISGDLFIDGSVSANSLVADSAMITFLNARNIVAGSVAADWVYAGNIDAGNITSGVITGRTFQTASSGERFVVDVSSKAAHFYDSTGAGKVWIGTASNGGLDCYAVYGSISDVRNGLIGLSYGASGLMGASVVGVGVKGVATTGLGVYGTSTSGSGVFGYSLSGYGGEFNGAKAPLRIQPSVDSTAPTHSADTGAIWVSSIGNFYGCRGGTDWVLLN